MICNLCLKPFNGEHGCGYNNGVFITVCSHVFCGSCARSSFTTQITESFSESQPKGQEGGTKTKRQGIVLCPVCDTPLTIPDGVHDQGTVFQSLCPALRDGKHGEDDVEGSSPCDDKEIVPLVMQHLCGFDPSTLIFMAQKAAEFWMYQQKFYDDQATSMLTQQVEKSKEESQAIQVKLTELQNMLQAEQRKTTLMMEECEEQRSRADDLQEKIIELTRQKRKLTELYNNVKARHQELVDKVSGRSSLQLQSQSEESTQLWQQTEGTSRVPLEQTKKQEATKEILKPTSNNTVGSIPVKCVFPRATPSLVKKDETSTPMKRPPLVRSSQGNVILNLSSATTMAQRQPILVRRQQTQERATSSLTPPSEKKSEIARKWDMLASCFDQL